MEDDIDNDLFARHKELTERNMKIAVALLAAVFLFVLYFLMKNG